MREQEGRKQVAANLKGELANLLSLAPGSIEEYLSSRDGRLARHLKARGRDVALAVTAFYSARLDGLPADEVRMFLSDIDSTWLPITEEERARYSLKITDTAVEAPLLEHSEILSFLIYMTAAGPAQKVVHNIHKPSFWKRLLDEKTVAKDYRWMAELCESGYKQVQLVHAPSSKYRAQFEAQEYCHFLAGYYFKLACEADTPDKRKRLLGRSNEWLRRKIKAIDASLACHPAWASMVQERLLPDIEPVELRQEVWRIVGLAPDVLKTERSETVAQLARIREVTREAREWRRWIAPQIEAVTEITLSITVAISRSRDLTPQLARPMQYFNVWFKRILMSAKERAIDYELLREFLSIRDEQVPDSAVAHLYKVAETMEEKCRNLVGDSVSDWPTAEREVIASCYSTIAMMRIADFWVDLSRFLNKNPRDLLKQLERTPRLYRTFIQTSGDVQQLVRYVPRKESRWGRLDSFKLRRFRQPHVLNFAEETRTVLSSYVAVFAKLWATLVPDADPVKIVSMVRTLEGFYDQAGKVNVIPHYPLGDFLQQLDGLVKRLDVEEEVGGGPWA